MPDALLHRAMSRGAAPSRAVPRSAAHAAPPPHSARLRHAARIPAGRWWGQTSVGEGAALKALLELVHEPADHDREDPVHIVGSTNGCPELMDHAHCHHHGTHKKREKAAAQLSLGTPRGQQQEAEQIEGSKHVEESNLDRREFPLHSTQAVATTLPEGADSLVDCRWHTNTRQVQDALEGVIAGLAGDEHRRRLVEPLQVSLHVALDVLQGRSIERPARTDQRDLLHECLGLRDLREEGGENGLVLAVERRVGVPCEDGEQEAHDRQKVP
mmetsp:Transcript_45322/g.142140  ORF Transcript_45322/g.142140 Transcript_45322/m.142140 type:complete len:271 (-) Transcript_45322:555-1367(-)